jgi:ATP-dependent RNA helicase RhlE
MTQFADLGLSPKILKALEKTTITTPTPIQVQAIPLIMAGRDLMGLAQTGTGKTAAFGLPLLHRLLDLGHPPRRAPCAP